MNKELILLILSVIIPGGFLGLGIWKAFELYKKYFKKIKSDAQIILSDEDAKMILKFIENPQEPNEELKKAFKNYEEKINKNDTKTKK